MPMPLIVTATIEILKTLVLIAIHFVMKACKAIMRTQPEGQDVSKEPALTVLDSKRPTAALNEPIKTVLATPPATLVDSKTPLTVFFCSLSNLAGTVVDLDPLATACRFRLLDCTAFLDSDDMRVIEYPLPSQNSSNSLTSFPLPSFTAISYPWRDLQLPKGMTVTSFSVSGALHADPISIDVLRTACLAARAFSCSYLWLDRLCILQTQKRDKQWQIQRMYTIYKTCDPCLVLPGGLVRLAGLSEPTTWIDRAWTLQEASAPGRGKVKCVFKFTHTSYHDFLDDQCNVEGIYSDQFRNFLHHTPDPIETVIEKGRSAACDILLLFRLMSGGMAGFRHHEPSLSEHHDKFPVRIIYTPAARLLQSALKTRNSLALWKSAYARSSSRPVDMVFSFMDLLGVNLDVTQFGQEDRTKATIKLIQEIMKRGGNATWLYIAPAMRASREISTLPEMPETSESGRAYISTRNGRLLAFEAIGVEDTWQTAGAPRGEMTDSGYFVFRGQAVLVAQQSEAVGTWHSRMKVYDNRETWAIIIGRLKNLNRDPETWKVRLTPYEAPKPLGVYELTMMFVERHSYGLFHRVGMEREIDERITAGWDWTYREFSIGGPGREERKRFDATPAGPMYITSDS